MLWWGGQHYWWLRASRIISAWAGDGGLGASLIRDAGSSFVQCVQAASISFERPRLDEGKGPLSVWANPITHISSYWIATQIARHGSREEVTALLGLLAKLIGQAGIGRMIWELVLTAMHSPSFDFSALPPQFTHRLASSPGPSRGFLALPSELLRLQCEFARAGPLPDEFEVLWHLVAAYGQGIQPPQFVFELILGGDKEKVVVESAHPYLLKPLAMKVQFPHAVAVSVETHRSHASPSGVVTFRLPSQIKFLRFHEPDPLSLNTYAPIRVYSGNCFPLEALPPQELDWLYCAECHQVAHGQGFHCANCDVCVCAAHRDRATRRNVHYCPRHVFFRASLEVTDFVPADPPLRYGVDDGPHQATCSGCSVTPIVGTRWQCGHCDTNFCDNCSPAIEAHNPLHYFLALTRPLEEEFKPPLAFEAKAFWGFKFTVRPLYKVQDRTTKSQIELDWDKSETAALVAKITELSERAGIPPEDFLPEDLPPEFNDFKTATHVSLLHHLNKHLLHIFPSVDLIRPFPGSFAALLLQTTHAIYPSVKIRIAHAYCAATVAPEDREPTLVEFDRFSAAETPGRDNSLFMQAFRQLSTATPVSLRTEQAYRAAFRGEGANDAGGPFRESLAELPINLVSPVLKVFIPCANAINDVGQGRECVVPNPRYLLSEEGRAAFKFVGRLLGIALRASQLFPITLPLPLWGVIQGTALKSEDLESWDTMSYSR